MTRTKKRSVVDLPTTRAKKARAVELICAGQSVTAVAAELGVDRATLWRWRQDPEFAERLQQRRDEIADGLHDELLALTADGVSCLREQLRGRDDTGSPVRGDMARIKAVQVLFELLGHHKGNAVRPVVRQGDPETEEDVAELLRAFPRRLITAEIERRDKLAAED